MIFRYNLSPLSCSIGPFCHKLMPVHYFDFRPNNVCDLKEMTLEEQVFGEEEFYPGEIKNETEDMNIDSGPGVTKINHPEDLRLLNEGHTCLVYESCLLKLASTHVSKICNVKGCNSSVTQRTENIGSALYIYWVLTVYCTLYSNISSL